MKSEKITQFVSFDTTLDTDAFIQQWEQYSRSVNIDQDVTLQQTEKKSSFRYIAQHRCNAGEFKFVFTKGKKTSRLPEVGIQEKQAGGYSMIQAERQGRSQTGETKVLVFLQDNRADLAVYRLIPIANKLNIYEPYYENCQYAYILEYFVKAKDAAAMTEQLKAIDPAVETGVYRECALQLA
jgi:hypothetical protein